MARRKKPRTVAPAPADATSGATPPPARAATAHQDVSGAGAKRTGPRWPDICDRLWKVVLGCGLGRKHRSRGGVVNSLRQNGSRDTVVVDLGHGVVSSIRKQYVVTASNSVPQPQDGKIRRSIMKDSAMDVELMPPTPTPRRQNSVPPTLEPLRVNGFVVSDEVLAKYAIYCQDSLKYRKKVICHMCVFDQQRYYGNYFSPTSMLKHCKAVHNKVGLECNHPECRVRVSTEEERIIHVEFCHRLDSGWWDNDEYNLRLEKYYKQQA